jgi:tetratricopeptide (TPR) repeat protein
LTVTARAVHVAPQQGSRSMSTILELLEQARAAYGRRELQQAEILCRQALELDRGQADAWHLLGMVAHAAGRHAAAADLISRAIRIEGGRAVYHQDLADVFRSLSKLVEAEQSIQQALRLAPDRAASHHTLGVIRIEQRRLAEAVASCRKAIELAPDLALAYSSLGLALHESGQRDEAAAACRQAIARDPLLATAHHELGRILQEQGDAPGALEAFRTAVRIDPQLAEAENGIGTVFHLQALFDQAIAHYHRALAIRPNYDQAHCNLGSALKDLGRLSEAAHCYQRAIECNPLLAEAHFNLGVLLQRQGHVEAAIACYEAAVRARPTYAQAHNNLGTLYAARGETDRAAECYAKTLAARPDSAEALNNMGNVRKVQGRLDEARRYYAQSLAANAGYAQAHHNRGLLLLADGDYAAGWPEYEWRLQCPDFSTPSLDCPRWQGEPLAGRIVLVHAEQGLGDTLQFVRFLPLVKERGGSIKLEVQPSLVPLLRSSGLGDMVELIGQDEPPGRFDLHVPLLSLPGILGITPDTIPAAGGYLSADPRLVEHWRGVLEGGARLKVGIAWQGKTTHRADRFRSIPLDAFAPLALAGVELVSLQKGMGVDQLAGVAERFEVRQLGADFDAAHGAFMDTAAVMKNLDLVITADTAIVHLAGALAVPTWVALTLVPDWRWMHQRCDSPWYTSVRLFRQQRLGDWSEVFTRMAGELAALKPAG